MAAIMGDIVDGIVRVQGMMADEASSEQERREEISSLPV